MVRLHEIIDKIGIEDRLHYTSQERCHQDVLPVEYPKLFIMLPVEYVEYTVQT